MRQYNSTIRVNKKNLDCGHYDFDFSKGRCRDCARVQDALAKDQKEIQYEEDLSGLIQDADVLVSRYVRLSAADSRGLVHCVTCPIVLPWTQMDAGHFIPRACLFLRHDLRNVHPQCQDCNRYHRGRPAKYSVYLGFDMVEWLMQEARLVHKVTRDELRAVISDMTLKLSKIKIPCP